MPFTASRLRAAVNRIGNQRVEHIALAIANEAIQLAPVDTGELKQSIRARMINPRFWRASAHAPHALHVEFGTLHTRAQPYLRPAIVKVLGRL